VDLGDQRPVELAARVEPGGGIENEYAAAQRFIGARIPPAYLFTVKKAPVGFWLLSLPPHSASALRECHLLLFCIV
jgi:hypothetical protein